MPTHHRERRRTINASAGSEHPSPKRANAKTASLGPEHPTSWISLHATQHEVLNTAQNEGPGCFGKVIGWPWVTSRGPRAPLGPGQFLKVSDPEIPRWQHPPPPQPELCGSPSEIKWRLWGWQRPRMPRESPRVALGDLPGAPGPPGPGSVLGDFPLPDPPAATPPPPPPHPEGIFGAGALQK